MGFFHSLPIPEIWEWIFLFPSRSRISGMGFFNSLPVPEPSKVIPAHPCFPVKNKSAQYHHFHQQQIHEEEMKNLFEQKPEVHALHSGET